VGPVTAARELLVALADLIFPVDCPGCGEPGVLCAGCAAVLAARPEPVRPAAPPPGLPPCLALGEYGGALRELILAYKERGRRDLAGPLGDALAGAVVATLARADPGPTRYGYRGDPGPTPYGHRGGDTPGRGSLVALVPVPSTAAAVRARQGDHMLRLARRAAGRLARTGIPVEVVRPLRARPRADSAGLDRAARARAAEAAFVPRPGADRGLGMRRGLGMGLGWGWPGGATVVVLDDVLTTGATVAAVSRRLAGAGAPVAGAVTLAATRLRRGGSVR
jgi:predicted amidophosphoribosyltransferase